MKCDDEEKALLESFENDEWTSVDDVTSEARRLERAARATLRDGVPPPRSNCASSAPKPSTDAEQPGHPRKTR